MDNREVQSLLALCRMFDIDCMVRPASVERNRLYRYLEDGASGFLIPFTSNKEIAQQIVEGAKFPPLGNRGLDGAGLDADFGIEAWAANSTYIRDATNETFIFGQVETPDAVLKADEVAAVPGIDGLYVGTGDMGLRLGATPHPDVKSVENAVEQVAAAAHRQGKVWGAATGSVESVFRYRKMGAQIITWGGDFALRQVLANCSKELDAGLGD
jgi:2-keto-3-deoxy-L-rhamnonate aldolase RhmA